jgi:hypothetical protein
MTRRKPDQVPAKILMLEKLCTLFCLKQLGFVFVYAGSLVLKNKNKDPLSLDTMSV